MSDSIRNIIRLAVVFAGLALTGQAQAATATLDCGSGTPTWNSGTSTLTCSGGGTQCAISGPSSAVINTQFTLTANCPSGSNYVWTGTGGASSCSGTTCNVTETSTGTKNYTVDTESATTSANFPVTITSGPVPAGCSLTASPTSGSTATNVTLTASCTSGTDPIGVAWTGTGTGSCPTTFNVGGSAQCVMSNVAATTTWTASFTNSVGAATNNPRSATFTYNAGGGGAFAGCPGGTVTIDGQWNNSAIDTAQWGEFGGNMVSIRVSPPVGWSSGTKTSSWAEYGAAPTVREAVFSTKACDFTNTFALKTSLGVAQHIYDSIGFYFKYKSGSSSTSAVGLTAGQHYYINIRNYYSTGQPSCTIGDCRMRGGLPE